MTIDCGSCGARYNIQDSLIPPQGARVKCKKCATMITIPPPPLTELAPQDLELIPPAPEPTPPPVPEPPTSEEVPRETFSQGFENSPEPAAASGVSASSSDLSLERYPQEPPPETPTSDEFERGGVQPRFGSPPSFTEASTPSGPSYGSTMTIEPITASPAAVEETESRPAMTVPSPETQEEPVASADALVTPAAEAPATESTSMPVQSPLPSGLSPEERSAHEKARRLARVLASDISIYNREKKERGIREGNLVAMLGYEIKKSWEIYKERVGSEFANSTPYFRDALNDLLADGKKIF
jgi:predicted Zn finger-like uncharacterized protein